MDDALSRASSDTELHSLHDSYLASGFVLRPRHLKILASRGFKQLLIIVLHKNMTSNALHILRSMRQQINTRIGLPLPPKGIMPILGIQELNSFKTILHDDIIYNEMFCFF